MKEHDVRNLAGLLESLCHKLRDNPYDLHNLEALLLGVIELTSKGKSWKATSIALEASSFLADDLVRAKASKPSRHVVSTYTQVKCETPKPAATVEQMQAAADAAAKDHWFVCTGCGKRTATSDGKGPLGWVFNAEVDGEVYKALCTACFATGILKDYRCDICGETTSSRQHPPPNWIVDEEKDSQLCSYCKAEP